MKQNLFTAAVIMFLSSFIAPLKKTDVKSAHPYFEYSFTTVGVGGLPDLNLERLPAVYQQPKNKTAAPLLNITGAKSVVRLKSGTSEFLAHPAAGESATAAAVISLYKLNTDKKNRSLSLDATGTISATKVILTIAQTDEQTLKLLIFNGILSPGEYAFTEKNMAAANSTLIVWCFGID